MKEPESNQESMLEQAGQVLQPLKDVPGRNPARAMRARQAFLEQAKSYSPAVSTHPKARPIRWSAVLFPKKERRTMSAFTTILLILVMIFGGGGATAVAAQSSQPDQALYPVKLFTEDFRLMMAGDAPARLALLLEFTQTRAEEISALANQGAEIPEAVQTRYQAQVEQMIQLALGMNGDLADQTLERLRTQQTTMLELHTGTGAPDGDQAVLRIREMLRERISWLEDGAVIPLQQRNQQQQQNAATEDPVVSETVVDPGSAPGGDAPQYQGEGNPWTTGTPTPGSGYGPGAQATPGPKGGKP